MRMQFGTFFFFFVCTLTARNAQAQQLVPGVLTLHAEEVAWQESPVGWEMAGKHLDVGYCMVFEFKDGRIIHGRENFLDLYTWDEFWS